MGGYGLKKFPNQHRAGKTTHQRRSSKHHTQPPSRSHDRKRLIPHSSSVHKHERNSPRLRLQTPSRPLARAFPEPISHQQQIINDQPTFNAVMWQRNTVMDYRYGNPQFTFPVERGWDEQQSPRSYMAPQGYGFGSGNIDSRVHTLGTHTQAPRAQFCWNDEQWLINEMNQQMQFPNMAWRAEEDATMHADPFQWW